MLGDTEWKRVKVTALNLFHPTASSLFGNVAFFTLRHSLEGEGNPFIPPLSRGRRRGGRGIRRDSIKRFPVLIQASEGYRGS
jgi:hypothetical protein